MPYCTYCGVANIADAQFCKMCAARIGVPIIMAPAAPVAMVPTITRTMAAAARLPLKSPGLAGLLSAVWPGVGQLYTGRAVGLAQMIFVPCGYAVLISLAFFSLALGEFLIALLLVLATLWVWMKVVEDAARARKGSTPRGRTRERREGGTGRWLCAILLSGRNLERADEDGDGHRQAATRADRRARRREILTCFIAGARLHMCVRNRADSGDRKLIRVEERSREHVLRCSW